MRLSVFFLCVMAAQTWALDSYSQVTRLSLNLKDTRVIDVLGEIEDKTEFFFLFNQKLLDAERKVDIEVRNRKIDDILNELFAGTNVNYLVMNRQIVLTTAQPGSEEYRQQTAAQQQGQVNGKVTDRTGTPLPGVTVVIRGTTTGTITDGNGNYSLSNIPANSTLVFSFVGMRMQEVVVGNQTAINVSLQEETFGIEEVVAVGYGTQKKVNITGAVSAVNASALENRPVTNISAALQGLLPGATIIQNSGQPGKDIATIRIRGIGTLNNANPMYVVDGIVVSNMNDIDPNDIESISILKDAASAAIYGSRASNGVVLITTKKGTVKENTLKYDAYMGWQQPTEMLEYLPSWEYAELFNQARVNQKIAPAFTADEIKKFKDGSDTDNYPNTDWLGMFYKKSGFQHSHRAELSGGVENTTYLFSLGYLDQGGIIDHAQFKRYSARTNITTTLLNKVTASMNLAFTFGDTQEPTNPYTGDMYQIFRQINRISPWVPYKYSTGHYGYIADGNPLAWMDMGAVRLEKYRKTRGIGNVSYEPVKGLKFEQILGYEYTGSSDEKFIKDIQYYNWKTNVPTFRQGPNSQTESRSDFQMVSLQSLLTYEKLVGKHSLAALAGFSREYNRYDMNYSYRKDFLNNELWEINAGSRDGMVAEGSAYEVALQSYFGRLSYIFNDKYLFEANIRYDGTSRFKEELRWGTFPSFSAGWRVINEPFMEGLKDIFSDLKVRGGWGLLGNQNIGNYPYQSVLSEANYTFGGNIYTGRALIEGVNQEVKWESSETTNIGIDFGLLSNKITLSVDYYTRNTFDILLMLPAPTPFGLSNPYQNVGEVSNKGIEFQLAYRVKAGDWNFNVLANAAYNKNEIVNLGNNGARIWLNSYTFLQEGYPINSFGGYRALGLFRDQEDLDKSAVINRSRAGLGDIKYEDVKPDGVINAEDRVFLGNSIPAWTFGKTLGIRWKNLDLQMLIQGAANVKGYLQIESVGELQGNTTKPTTIFRDSYDKDTNPTGNFPRPLSTWTHNYSSVPSSFWIVNASYARLKNLQFGYTIPEKYGNIAGVSRARVYYSGQNLFTFSGLRKGFDPEAPAGARAYYPQVKTNTIGVSLTF